MHRINEFKGYRSIAAYDAESECFVQQRVSPVEFAQTENAGTASPSSEIAKLKRRVPAVKTLLAAE